MSMDNWRVIFRDCLGGSSVQYCDEIAPLLVAVDQGVKPALLWDVSAPETSSLLKLLKESHEKKLTNNRLILVEVDVDLFIVNRKVLKTYVCDLLSSSQTWLVDISNTAPKVASSEVHQQFSGYLKVILSQLGYSTTETTNSTQGNNEPQQDSNSNNENTCPPCVSITSLPEDVNLSTIFGCLLGYPHIYWWNADSEGNSLTGMPLKVYKLSATYSVDGSQAELFSFSIPEALEPDLRSGIELWGNTVNILVARSTKFANAQFKCDPVLCLSVAL